MSVAAEQLRETVGAHKFMLNLETGNLASHPGSATDWPCGFGEDQKMGIINHRHCYHPALLPSQDAQKHQKQAVSIWTDLCIYGGMFYDTTKTFGDGAMST